MKNGRRKTPPPRRRPENASDVVKVTGRAVDQDARPIANARVDVIRKQLKDRIVLGSARTDKQGKYVVELDRRKMGASSRHLIVEIRKPKAAEPLAVTSFDVRNGTRAGHDVAVRSRQPLFTRITERLSAIGGKQISELPPDAYVEVAKLAGFGRATIARYAAASRMADALDVSTDIAFALTSAAGLAQESAIFGAEPARLRKVLRQAMARKHIAPMADADIERAVQRIERRAVDAMAGERFSARDLRMQDLLRIAGSDEAASAHVARHWHCSHTAPARFWRNLARDGQLTTRLKQQLQNAAAIGALAGGDAEIVESLIRVAPSATAKDIAGVDVVALTESLGQTLAIDRDRAESLAGEIVARAKDAYPTAATLAQIRREVPGAAVLLDTLNGDAQFDVHRSPLNTTVRGHAAFKALAPDEQRAVLDRLQPRQRIIRLGATFGETDAVLRAGFTSATHIVSGGKTHFVDALAPEIGPTAAEAIHARAEDAVSKAALLLLKYGPVAPGLGTVAVPTIPITWDDDPDLASLFLDQPLCACERCRSVTGPAAYLVDLLQLLRDPENNVATKTNALAALTNVGVGPRGTRRPDLTRIELSCDNSNIAIPYIDIVLEVLENAVVSPDRVTAHQTTAPAEVIAQSPEHVVSAAYDRLAGAVYPLTLPFDVHHEEIQTIASLLGTSRSDMTDLFSDLAPVSDPATEHEYLTLTARRVWQSESAAGAVFGMSRAERKVIAGQPIDSSVLILPNAFWGLDTRLDWASALKKVSVFMQRSGLSYAEVRQLCALQALHVAAPLRIVTSDSRSCDPSDMTIEGLDEEVAARLHRFIRLYRRLAWELRDLDRAVSALAEKDSAGSPRLDAGLLVRLSQVERLRRRCAGASVAEVLSWWNNIDTATYDAEHFPNARSLYQEVFERDRQTAPGAARIALDQVRAGAAGKVGDNVDVLAACLGLSPSHVIQLIDALHLAGETLSLERLSLLYRWASLSRRLAVSIPDLLAYRILAGDPFVDGTGASSPIHTLAFLDRFDACQQRSVPVTQLLYVCGAAATSTSSPPAAVIQRFHDGIVRAAGDEVAILQQVAREFEIDVSLAHPLLHEWMRMGDGRSFAARLADQTQPFSLAETTEIYVRLHKVAWFLELAGNVSMREAEWIFEEAPAAGLLDIRALPATTVSEARVREMFSAWRRWERWLELRDAIPASKRDELVTVFELGRAAPAESTARSERDAYINKLTDVTGWDAADIRALVGRIDDTTGHRVSTLDTAFRQHFGDEQLPYRVLQCMRFARRLQLSVTQLAPDAFVAREPVSQPAALVRAARTAIKARVGEEQWPRVAAEIRNTMRERQRRALVDYVVAAWRLKDSGDLYDHFLLDVEMSACRKTTRIEAATHSVQLFIDRCLMNLEDRVQLTQRAAEQWEWMKRYAVWESSRKIFLYPENYLRQELRRDRTPFFRELEDELKQTDITHDTAEAALRHYIEKVDEVSRLQMCGIYVEDAGDGGVKATGVPQVIHVFGRTRNAPHVYFHRQWINGVRWTPWEQVDVDIEGDHLVPVVYYGRLYLFWPVISEKDGGPFNLEAFLRPLLDLVNFVMQAVRTGGAVVHAVLGAYNETVEAIEQSVEEVVKVFAVGDDAKAAVDSAIDFDSLKIDPDAFDDLPGDPVESAIQAVGAGLKLLFDVMQQHPLLRVLELLPKKEYAVQLAWSERRHGAWTPKKLSHTDLVFTDVTGPLLREMQEILQEGQVPAAEAPTAADTAFDRRRLFTFNARAESGNLIVQTHVTRLGLDMPGSEDANTTYLKFLGDFVLDDVHGAVTARRPPVGSFDFAADALANLQELALGALQSATQFVSGEPITQDDDPQGTLKQGIMRDLFDVPGPEGYQLAPLLARPSATQYRLLGAHQYQTRWVRPAGLIAQFNPNTYVAADERLERQFFFQDACHSFWCWNNTFQTHYHPFITRLMYQLHRHGIAAPGLMDPAHQNWQAHDEFDAYRPTDAVARPHPSIDIDYELSGAYAVYNWELFVHAPLLIAERLKAAHRHADAERWLHFVFDPTDRRQQPAPARYWRPGVFARTSSADYHQQNIVELMRDVAGDATADVRRELEAQVDAWREDPFEPFTVARLRTVAFQRGVLLQYIDNLIAWGDQMFREGSAAGDMAAGLLYRRAAQLLGPRPQHIPGRRTPAKTFAQLATSLDNFSNALVQLEHRVVDWHALPAVTALPALAASQPRTGATVALAPSGVPARDVSIASAAKDRWRDLIDTAWTRQLTAVKDLYFCIPPNAELLKRWDIVEDRQWKIRHCRDIDGRFAGALVPTVTDAALSERAAELGLDLAEVLSQVAAPAPHYRFSVLCDRALDACNDVKALGAALLGAMEKRDAERFAGFKQEQERAILQMLRTVKRQAIVEAKANCEVARLAAQSADIRQRFYVDNLSLPVSALELTQLALFGTSLGLQAVEAGMMAVASGLSLVPEVLAGFPIAATQTGGVSTSSASERAAQSLGRIAAVANSAGSMVGIMAGYERRRQEWELQLSLAEQEIKQSAAQVLAADARLQIAERELQHHDLQVEQNLRTTEFLRSKFTNEELYEYMVAELTALHDAAYALAFDMARQAEHAGRIELCVPLDEEPHLITYGHWDSLRSGLTAGDHLHAGLKRLQAQYLQRNRRRLEIPDKKISLRQFFPLAFMTLQETGACEIALPEWIFDMDYAGHYQRRISSVALSIPCVTGPYTNVNCTLTLKTNTVRMTDDHRPDYNTVDARFYSGFSHQHAIVTTHARSDSGLFQLDLNDERYRPFEGAGVVSSWRIELPKEQNFFDLSTVSDVILHVSYTALQGSDDLKSAAVGNLRRTLPATGTLWINFAHTFPTEWHRLFHALDAATDQALAFDLTSDHFPFFARGKQITIRKLHQFVTSPTSAASVHSEITPPGRPSSPPIDLVQDGSYGDLFYAADNPGAHSAVGPWRVALWMDGAADRRSLTADELQRLIWVIEYDLA